VREIELGSLSKEAAIALLQGVKCKSVNRSEPWILSFNVSLAGAVKSGVISEVILSGNSKEHTDSDSEEVDLELPEVQLANTVNGSLQNALQEQIERLENLSCISEPPAMSGVRSRSGMRSGFWT
jgi:hypothetical protein